MILDAFFGAFTMKENAHFSTYSSNARSRQQRSDTWRLAATLILTLTTLLSVCEGDGMCGACLNGGRLLMPNNIFGYCRCRCAGEFKGPRCQFLKKRDIGVEEFGGEEAGRHGKVLRSHPRPPRPVILLDELLERLAGNSGKFGQSVSEDTQIYPSNTVQIRQPLSSDSSKYSPKSGETKHHLTWLEGKNISIRSDAITESKNNEWTLSRHSEHRPADYSMDSRNANGFWRPRNSENGVLNMENGNEKTDERIH